MADSPVRKLSTAANDGAEAFEMILNATIGNDREPRIVHLQAEVAREALRSALAEIASVDVKRGEVETIHAKLAIQRSETKERIKKLKDGAQGSIEGTIESVCPRCDGAMRVWLDDGTLEIYPCIHCNGRGTMPPMWTDQTPTLPGGDDIRCPSCGEAGLVITDYDPPTESKLHECSECGWSKEGPPTQEEMDSYDMDGDDPEEAE